VSAQQQINDLFAGLMKPDAPESLARRVLGLDTRTSVHHDVDAVKSAFRQKVKDPVSAGASVDEIMWARDLLVYYCKRRESSAAAGWGVVDKTAPRVTNHALLSGPKLNSRNALILEEVDRDFQRRKQQSEEWRKRDPWTRNDPWWQKSEDEHFTELALAARLVCHP
jgi:hypothetical protein